MTRMLSFLIMLFGVGKDSGTIRGRRGLITNARHICLAAILFSLLAGTAWGQDKADLRISTLTRELKQGDRFVRWRAAKALVRIGSYSKVAVPALIEALKVEEGEISDRARDALVKIGADAVPGLIEALRYRDSPAYGKAIEAMAAIGPPTVPALIVALKDDEALRLGALEALREISLQGLDPRPPTLLPVLFEALKDPNPAIRRAAIQNIHCTGAKTTPGYLALIEALKDPDPEVRGAADFAICCVGLTSEHPAAQAALALLLEDLKNPDANVRSDAVRAFVSLRSNAKPALAALIEASKDADEKVRANVARALGAIAPTADAVVATLLVALSDPDKRVRSASASALMSAPARAVVYPLILTLQDREASVRRNAANSLARRNAGFAAPRLIRLLNDPDTEVRNAAGKALEAIGPGAAQALVKASKNQDANIRKSVALIFVKVDLYAALPVQIEALKDEDASVRSAAAASLGWYLQGPEEKTVIPALIAALKDRDASVRSSAAFSLGNQEEPKLVVPILIAALKDQDPQVRSKAASVLGAVWPPVTAAIPALIDLLGDPNTDVLRNAIGALGKINTAATAAVIIPRLVRLLNHHDRGIQEAVIGALAAIGEPAAPALAKLLMGQDSYLRIKTYYALAGQGNESTLIAILKTRDKRLRSLVIEAIDEIGEGSKGSVEGTVLLFDPARKYLFHKGMTGCGYENEGRTIFVTEIDSGKSFPILASCNYLTLTRFLEYGGKNYLLIAEENGGAGNPSFWLYDMKANEYVIHAKGVIDETKPGVFSYAQAYDEHDALIPAGKVTIKNLLNRKRPLKLLPRYPMHGLTRRRDTRVFHTFDECSERDTNPFELIRNAGTRVFVIAKCEDGSYEIFFKGGRGNVPKGSLKPTK